MAQNEILIHFNVDMVLYYLPPADHKSSSEVIVSMHDVLKL